MIGTIVNAIAIAAGGLIGIIFKKWIKEEYSNRVLKVIGLAVFVVALMGIIKSMITINVDGSFTSNYELVIIICLSCGTLLGELLKIEDHLNDLSLKIEKKFVKDDAKQGTFTKGFITASLVACLGAMALVGSINDALGDPSTLFIKSVIDFVTMILLGSTLGYGVIFASISVFLYQGFVTVLGLLLNNFMSQEFINAFSALGNTMILAIAFNFISETKIKVANTLPSILLLIVYFIFKTYIF